MTKPNLISKISKLNVGHTVKLRTKPGKKGYSLYFDLVINNQRSYEFLKLYISGKPADTAKDENILAIANELRLKREQDLIRDNFRLPKKSNSEVFIVDYAIEITPNVTINLNKSVNNYLKLFDKGTLIGQVDKKYCKEFYEFILSKGLAVNSAANYFNRLKYILNRAVEDELIASNPAKTIKVSTIKSKREFLTQIELAQFVTFPFKKDRQLRNAYLFSCFTGLRMSDVINLKFTNIKDNRIIFRQKKTKQDNVVYLTTDALQIIEEQSKTNSNYIFKLPCAATIERRLSLIIRQAGIDRHLTFHSARHTFATLALQSDVDIYTVSKMLGHTDIKTTQIYLHLIDKRKELGMEKLPTFLNGGNYVTS